MDTLTADMTQAPDSLRGRPGRETPLPDYVLTTDRLALPLELDWYGERDRPAIGERVEVTRADEGLGTVVGYFHKGGVLGVGVALDTVPAWLELPEADAVVRVYGDEFEPVEEAGSPGPALLTVSHAQAVEALPESEEFASNPLAELAEPSVPVAPVAAAPAMTPEADESDEPISDEEVF